MMNLLKNMDDNKITLSACKVEKLYLECKVDDLRLLDDSKDWLYEDHLTQYKNLIVAKEDRFYLLRITRYMCSAMNKYVYNFEDYTGHTPPKDFILPEVELKLKEEWVIKNEKYI